jgi:hypothetical protein
VKIKITQVPFIEQTRGEGMELSIQERLKDLRVERGLTLEQLADRPTSPNLH